MQLANPDSPMEMTLSGIVMETKAAHPENADLPMDVTLLPIFTEVKVIQSANAYSPMDETLFPIVADFILGAYPPLTLNMYAGTLVTPSPKVTLHPAPDVPALQNTSLPSAKSVQLTALNLISVSDEQFLKVYLPMDVTPLPIITEARDVQSANADSPM